MFLRIRRATWFPLVTPKSSPKGTPVLRMSIPLLRSGFPGYQLTPEGECEMKGQSFFAMIAVVGEQFLEASSVDDPTLVANKLLRAPKWKKSHLGCLL